MRTCGRQADGPRPDASRMLSPGKLWGLRRMADSNGLFRMVAVDQRPPIKKPISTYYGTDTAPYDDVARVKTELIEALGPTASAMLLDPHYAVPRGLRFLSPDKGLILTLEDSMFRENDGERLSSEIDAWSVEKIKRMGADAVKVLAWYRPDISETVRAEQRDFVRRTGEACERYDIPFLFELLVYPLEGDRDQTRDYREMAGKRAEHVLASVEEFAAPDYGVDLFKLEAPVQGEDVPEPNGEGGEEVQGLFDELGRLANRPWVMLSAGASQDAFLRVLAHAYRAGASGYLAGRAIWLDAFAHYPDWTAMREALQTNSVPYVNRINALTAEQARPWFEHPCYGSPPDIAPPDGSFRYSYEGFAATERFAPEGTEVGATSSQHEGVGAEA